MVKGVYQPRNPQASGLYQCLAQHFDGFESIYEDAYQERYGFYRSVIRKVVKKFLDCGDLTQGFARVQCESSLTWDCGPTPPMPRRMPPSPSAVPTGQAGSVFTPGTGRGRSRPQSLRKPASAMS
jgi:hypothetical protein